MLKEQLPRIDAFMKENGIFHNDATGKNYYTGYFYGHLYDWDQYFETITQLYLGWDTTFGRNGVEIFLDLQKENGHIQRSSCSLYPEQLSEHVKPFLSQICLVLFGRDGQIDFLKENDFYYYNRLKKYILRWLNRPNNFKGLAVWDSAMHSGMDNQHERAGYWGDCFGCGVDLNCYLVRECRAFAKIAFLFGKKEDEKEFLSYAETLKNTINEIMWNEEDGFYYDIDIRTGEQIKVRYIGVFATLWAEVANEQRAKYMIENYLFNEKEFNRGFIYPALSAAMPGYTNVYLDTDIPMGCSWRAYTWVPTNYYLFHSLRKYGYKDAATHLAKVTFDQIIKNGDREYYDTEKQCGYGLDPFWGWSLIAYFMPYEDETGFDPTEIDLKVNDHVLFEQPKGEQKYPIHYVK